MNEAKLLAAIEQCHLSSTLQLSSADAPLALYLNSIANRHNNSAQNVQLPYDSNGHRGIFASMDDSSMDAGNWVSLVAIKEPIDDFEIPEQNNIAVNTNMVIGNPGTAIVKKEFPIKTEPSSEMTEEYQVKRVKSSVSSKERKEKRKREEEQRAVHEKYLNAKQKKRAKDPRRYRENVVQCPDYRGYYSEQSAGCASGSIVFDDQWSLDGNQCYPYDSNEMGIDESQAIINENDLRLNSMTSPQAVLDNVHGEQAQKMKIAKVWIYITCGRVSFETSEGQEYGHCPLSNYVSTLRRSEVILGCEVHIVSGYPSESDASVRHFTDRDEFGQFSRDIHSIKHLWANGRVVAELNTYPMSKVLPLSDFSAELFSRDGSILACNVLEIMLYNSWPISIVTDVALQCNQLILKETPYQRQRLHYWFLNTLYEKKMPPHLDITLVLYDRSTKELIDALEDRFNQQCSVGQRFKFSLVCRRKIPDLLFLSDYGTFETTTVKQLGSFSTVRIEYRPCLSVPHQQSIGVQ